MPSYAAVIEGGGQSKEARSAFVITDDLTEYAYEHGIVPDREPITNLPTKSLRYDDMYKNLFANCDASVNRRGRSMKTFRPTPWRELPSSIRDYFVEWHSLFYQRWDPKAPSNPLSPPQSNSLTHAQHHTRAQTFRLHYGFCVRADDGARGCR